MELLAGSDGSKSDGHGQSHGREVQLAKVSGKDSPYCAFCSKPGHGMAQCRQFKRLVTGGKGQRQPAKERGRRDIRSTKTGGDDEGDCYYSTGGNKSLNRLSFLVASRRRECKLDSGADAYIMDHRTAEELRLSIGPTKITIRGIGSQAVNVVDIAHEVPVEVGGAKRLVDFTLTPLEGERQEPRNLFCCAVYRDETL